METILLLVSCMYFAFWCGKACSHDKLDKLQVILCAQAQEIQELHEQLDARQTEEDKEES